MTTIDTNMEAYSRYIKINLEGLKCQEERFKDTMNNMLKWYKVVRGK